MAGASLSIFPQDISFQSLAIKTETTNCKSLLCRLFAPLTLTLQRIELQEISALMKLCPLASGALGLK
jgi:hypothetical protein